MANEIVTLFESDGVTATDVVILGVGRQAAAASKSYAFSTEDLAAIEAITTAITAGAAAVLPGSGVAHSATDAGNPHKIGGHAVAGLSAQTPVTAGERTDNYSGLDGVMYVRPHCGLEDIVSGVASNTDGTSTSVIATAGAGIKQYLTSVTVVNMHASATAYVELKSGTTVMYRLPVPPGGVTQNFPVPLKPNAADEAWNFDPSAAVTTLYCSMVGFKSKV